MNLEALYTHAYDAYTREDYAEAERLFAQLVTHSLFETKYWKGFAAANQMLQNYDQALRGWSMLALLDEKDPLPHIHASECLYILGQTEEGQKALRVARSKPCDNPHLIEKIHVLRECYG